MSAFEEARTARPGGFDIRGAGETPAPQTKATTASIVVQASSLHQEGTDSAPETLESEFETELDHPRSATGTRDRTEGCVGHIPVGVAKRGCVRNVVSFGAELQ